MIDCWLHDRSPPWARRAPDRKRWRDNLAATFSPDLVDAQIYVIDVSEGDKIPRKSGPGITKSDLLVINKIDLAAWSTLTSASWNATRGRDP